MLSIKKDETILIVQKKDNGKCRVCSLLMKRH